MAEGQLYSVQILCWNIYPVSVSMFVRLPVSLQCKIMLPKNFFNSLRAGLTNHPYMVTQVWPCDTPWALHKFELFPDVDYKSRKSTLSVFRVRVTSLSDHMDTVNQAQQQ